MSSDACCQKQTTRSPLQTKWQQALTQFCFYKNEPKEEAAITAWTNSSISLLGSQLIFNMYASALKNWSSICGVRYTRLLPSCQAKTITNQVYLLTDSSIASSFCNKKRSYRINAAPLYFLWCRDQDLNQGHSDFQSDALPTELSRRHPKWRGNYMEG